MRPGLGVDGDNVCTGRDKTVNEELLLKPGMSADADIITKTLNNTFRLPKAALLYTPVRSKKKALFGSREEGKITIDPKPHVWTLENNQPKKVYVKVLGSSGSDSAISSKELQVGDPLIIMQETTQ